jgi:hypothetical protein
VTCAAQVVTPGAEHCERTALPSHARADRSLAEREKKAPYRHVPGRALRPKTRDRACQEIQGAVVPLPATRRRVKSPARSSPSPLRSCANLATFPDFPGIRAPARRYGVPGFQINFASRDVFAWRRTRCAGRQIRCAQDQRSRPQARRADRPSGAFGPQNLKSRLRQTRSKTAASTLTTCLPSASPGDAAAVRNRPLHQKPIAAKVDLGLMFGSCARSRADGERIHHGQSRVDVASNVLAPSQLRLRRDGEISHFRYEVPAAPVAKGT